MTLTYQAIASLMICVAAAPLSSAWVAPIGTADMRLGRARAFGGEPLCGSCRGTSAMPLVGNRQNGGALGLRGAISDREDDMTVKKPGRRARLANFVLSVSSRSWQAVKKRMTLGDKFWNFILGDIVDDVPKISGSKTNKAGSGTKTFVVMNAEDRERLQQLTSTMSLLTRASLQDVQNRFDYDAKMNASPKIEAKGTKTLVGPPATEVDEVDQFLEEQLASDPELKAAVDSVVKSEPIESKEAAALAAKETKQETKEETKVAEDGEEEAEPVVVSSVFVEGINEVVGGGLKTKVIVNNETGMEMSTKSTAVADADEAIDVVEKGAEVIQP